MSLRAFIVSSFGAYSIASSALAAQGGDAFLGQGQPTSAVDAKGVRHSARSGQRAPWLYDRVKAVGPEYPYADRARHHMGIGRFHLVLDLKTGSVANVTVIKSTGFPTLDAAAIAALRQWRWKPNSWKEIELPVTFEMAQMQTYALPPGAVPLPPK